MVSLEMNSRIPDSQTQHCRGTDPELHVESAKATTYKYIYIRGIYELPTPQQEPLKTFGSMAVRIHRQLVSVGGRARKYRVL